MTDDNITTITGAADPESVNNETMGSLEFSETAPVPQAATSNVAADLLDNNGFYEFTGMEGFAQAFQKEIYKNIPDDFPQTINLSDAGEILNALEVKINCIDLSQQWIKFYADYRDKSKAYPQGTAMANLAKAKEMLKCSIFSMAELVQSYNFQRIANLFPDFSDWINPRCQYFSLSDLLFICKDEETKNLLPDLYIKIETLKQQPEYSNLTFAEFVRGTIDQFSLFCKVYDSLQTVDPGKQTPEQETQEEKIYNIKSRLPEKRKAVTDIINNNFWNTRDSLPRYKNFPFHTERSGSDNAAIVNFTVSYESLEAAFDKLHIPSNVTLFDRKVYYACADLYLQNPAEPVFSISQIYALIRGDNLSKASATDFEKINTSLTKMLLTYIAIDNRQEITVNKNYPEFVYDGALLPFERVSGYINGQFSDALIHLFREPPMYSFAAGRLQLDTVERKVLLSPLHNTDLNNRIEYYLFSRILQLKNNHGNKKILYSSIYENCYLNSKDRKQKQRANEKIEKLLTHYVESEYIERYTHTKDGKGILITLKDKQQEQQEE